MKSSTSVSKARQMFGKNFLDFPVACKAFNPEAEEGNVAFFATVPFSPEFLEKRAESHLLVAEVPISLLQMVKLFPQFLNTGSRVYELPLASEFGNFGWHLIRKVPIVMDYQEDLTIRNAIASASQKILEIRLAVYTAMLCHAVDGGYLWQDAIAGCKEIGQNQRPLVFGLFDEDGPYLGELAPGARIQNIGYLVEEVFPTQTPYLGGNYSC